MDKIMKKFIVSIVLVTVSLFSAIAAYGGDQKEYCTYTITCGNTADFVVAKWASGYRTLIKGHSSVKGSKNFDSYCGVEAPKNLGQLRFVSAGVKLDGFNKKITVMCKYEKNITISQEFDYLHCSEADNTVHRYKPTTSVSFYSHSIKDKTITVKAIVSGNGSHF